VLAAGTMLASGSPRRSPATKPCRRHTWESRNRDRRWNARTCRLLRQSHILHGVGFELGVGEVVTILGRNGRRQDHDLPQA